MQRNGAKLGRKSGPAAVDMKDQVMQGKKVTIGRTGTGPAKESPKASTATQS